jgi:phosphate-selective porin OprO/OprP
MMRASSMSRWAIAGLLFALGLAPAARPLRAEEPAAPPLEDRLRKLEEINQAILERLDRSERDREHSEARYRDLEQRYEELRRKVEDPPREGPPAPPDGAMPEAAPPAPEDGPLPPAEPEADGPGPEAGPSSSGGDRKTPEGPRVPLFAEFEDGFALKSRDESYTLRFHVLDQTDFKVFVPGDQKPARSGLYIPRVRFYFEGDLTRLFQYEVSLQRSVEGVWDLLDGSLNTKLSEGFQVKFGRFLVPYSYDWYDHLEQYFITPERGLFPLNFGLSRSAGLMAHGRLFDDRVQYALGGFDGHLAGVADNNTTRDAVGYINVKPFLDSDAYPGLRNLNLGASGFLGQQVSPGDPLPLRTSLQSSENDDAAQSASSIFLQFDEDVFALGGRSAGAIHLAWYNGPFSFEGEWQAGSVSFAKRGRPGRTAVPIQGYHATAGYFLTGESVTGRTTVEPLRPFDPIRSEWGPGAWEVFARYSHLDLGDSVFDAELADRDRWTNRIGLTDIGFNWYLTRTIKLYFDWQRSYYGSPVILNPAKDLFGRTNDLFWIRCQFYF